MFKGKNTMPSNNIGYIIKSKGLKQSWVAEQVGVAETVMSLWVNNKRQPNASHLIKLSKVFDIHAEELFNV